MSEGTIAGNKDVRYGLGVMLACVVIALLLAIVG